MYSKTMIRSRIFRIFFLSATLFSLTACKKSGETDLGIVIETVIVEPVSGEIKVEEPFVAESVVVESAVEETKPPTPTPTPTATPIPFSGLGDGSIKTDYEIVHHYLTTSIDLKLEVNAPEETLSDPGKTNLYLVEPDISKQTIGIGKGETITVNQTLLPGQKIGITCPLEPAGKKTCEYEVSILGNQPDFIKSGLVSTGKEEKDSVRILENGTKSRNIFLVVWDNTKKGIAHHSTITIEDGFGNKIFAHTKEGYTIAVYTPMDIGGWINLWCTGDNGECQYSLYESPFVIPSKTTLRISYDKSKQEVSIMVVGPPGKTIMVIADTTVGSGWFSGVQTGMADPTSIFKENLVSPVEKFKYSLGKYQFDQDIRFQVITSDDPKFMTGVEISEVFTIKKVKP
jgi:hypothetical protein